MMVDCETDEMVKFISSLSLFPSFNLVLIVQMIELSLNSYFYFENIIISQSTISSHYLSHNLSSLISLYKKLDQNIFHFDFLKMLIESVDLVINLPLYLLWWQLLGVCDNSFISFSIIYLISLSFQKTQPVTGFFLNFCKYGTMAKKSNITPSSVHTGVYLII